jgi:hypothetical protein
MEISIYHAHELNKTIKSMALFYILPSPVKILEILHCPSGKFEVFVRVWI